MTDYNWQAYNYDKYNFPQHVAPPGQLLTFPIQVGQIALLPPACGPTWSAAHLPNPDRSNSTNFTQHVAPPCQLLTYSTTSPSMWPQLLLSYPIQVSQTVPLPPSMWTQVVSCSPTPSR